MRLILAFLLVIFLLLGGTEASQADDGGSILSPIQGSVLQAICADRDSLLEQLYTRYDELPIGVGVANGKLLEILSSKNGETFTILITTAKGQSCLIASGDGLKFWKWEDIDEGPGA